MEKKFTNLLKKLFKRAPKTPAHRPQDSTIHRTWSTPAQIAAFTEAFFDRAAYRAGEAPEMHIREPQKSIRAGYLDLTSRPLVSVEPTSDSPWLLLSIPPTMPERRVNRLRNGE